MQPTHKTQVLWGPLVLSCVKLSDELVEEGKREGAVGFALQAGLLFREIGRFDSSYCQLGHVAHSQPVSSHVLIAPFVASPLTALIEHSAEAQEAKVVAMVAEWFAEAALTDGHTQQTSVLRGLGGGTLMWLSSFTVFKLL